MIISWHKVKYKAAQVQVMSQNVRTWIIRTIEFALPDTMKGTTKPVVRVKSTRRVE